jgi:hypothetical protein
VGSTAVPGQGEVVPVVQAKRDAGHIARCSAIAVFAIATTFAPSAFALTQIDFVSDPGDYIGDGQIFSLTTADGSINATGTTAGIQINFLGTVFVSPKTS